jgi:hypothetical protein
MPKLYIEHLTLEEANKKLDGIVERNGDTVYAKALFDRYGMPVAIHLEGEFSPADLMEIANIAINIKKVSENSSAGNARIPSRRKLDRRIGCAR